MKHPPYHLRHNKAVDRFLLVDTLRFIGNKYPLSEYTYIGLGGPFLEDCRLISDYFPEIAIESIEEDFETFKRQKFHQFSRRIKLRNIKLSDFISCYTGNGRVVVWLDYTNLKMKNFDDFMSLLTKVPNYSIIKITLRGQIDNNPFQLPPNDPSNEESLISRKHNFIDNFRLEYAKILPASFDECVFERAVKFINLIQLMVKLAAAKALPSEMKRSFLLINSAYYTDNTYMYSATGVVTPAGKKNEVENLFRKWEYSCINRTEPFHIDLPILSVKERLTLERFLPLKNTTGAKLAKILKYQIDHNEKTSLHKMQQYNNFHRYYPYFAKVNV